MLASSWPRAFDDPDWGFEVKWDGIRVLLYWDGHRLELRSRRGRDVTDTYPELGDFSLSRPIVLDGEIVALDEEGRPSFQLLQARMNLIGHARIAEQARRWPISLMVFDLLYEEGELIDRPLRERRERLQAVELPPPAAHSLLMAKEGRAFFEAAAKRGLEGVVAKRLQSLYRPGARSPDWRKIAHVRTVRAAVGGFSTGEGARSDTFGSLLLGLWDDGALRYIGSVGTGFDDRTLRAIKETLDRLERSTAPFKEDPALPRHVTWVEPSLVAMVDFKEWTEAGRLRAPSFKGFTDDRPEVITWELEGPTA